MIGVDRHTEALLAEQDCARLDLGAPPALAVDGDGECLRVDLDLRRSGIADHVAFADPAGIVHRDHLPPQPELPAPTTMKSNSAPSCIGMDPQAQS